MTQLNDISFFNPLFQSEMGDGKSIPSSPIDMDCVRIDRKVFANLNFKWHSRLPECANCFEGVCFAMVFNNVIYAVAWWTKPIAANRLKYGSIAYELRRMAVNDVSPKFTASRFLSQMTKQIKKSMPNIALLLSYQDTEVHAGTIYKACNWKPVAQKKFQSWKNRKDFNRIDQSVAEKIRWEYVLDKRKLELFDNAKIEIVAENCEQYWLCF